MARNDDASIAHEQIWRGPLKDRNCTDVPCLIIFLLFILCWIGVGFYAIFAGDIHVVMVPTDSRGRRCGVDEEVKDKPVLIFFDLKKCTGDKCDTTQVCQSECPKKTWYFNPALTSMDDAYNSMLCDDGISVTNKDVAQLSQLIESDACAAWYIKSTPIFKRCLPNIIPDSLGGMNITIDELQDATMVIKLLSSIESIVNEAALTKGLVFMFIGVGMLLCLLYIVLLRWMALLILWASIILVIGLLTSFSYLFFNLYVEYDRISYIIVASISLIAAIIVALIALGVRKKIYIASQLITETSKATSHMLSVVFFPVIPWLIELAIIAYFVVIAILLISIEYREFIVREELPNGNCECSKEVNYTVGNSCVPNMFYKYCHENDGSCFSQSCRLNNVSTPSCKYYMYGIHIVGFTWLYFFIVDLKKIIIASAYATWYWTFHKKDIPFFILLASTLRIIKYHLGTVAFGSALLTICRIFRILLEYLHKLSKRQVASNIINPQVLNVLCWSCRCCMYLVERLLKFINRNAYIMCAIQGKGLCASAADALGLLMSNIILTGVLNRIISWLLFLGKVTVTSIMLFLAYLYFHEYQASYRNEYWFVPALLIGMGSYLVATVFFSVYTVGVDTIFLCVLQDCEYNDGSKEKPYYMNKNIGKVFNVK